MFYEIMVPMKSKMEKRNVTCEDVDENEFIYSIPDFYFMSKGEMSEPESVFDWKDDCVIAMTENHVLKCTCTLSEEVLVKTDGGESIWMEGRTADISG